MNRYRKEDAEMSILARLICGIAICICAYQISISDFSTDFKLVSGIFGLPFLYVVTSECFYQMVRRY